MSKNTKELIKSLEHEVDKILSEEINWDNSEAAGAIARAGARIMDHLEEVMTKNKVSLTADEFPDDMDILERVRKIALEDFFRKGKDRKYPPFIDAVTDTAAAASHLLGKEITPYDLCIIMVALKLNRNKTDKKYDNFLDSLSFLTMAYKITQNDQ